MKIHFHRLEAVADHPHDHFRCRLCGQTFWSEHAFVVLSEGAFEDGRMKGYKYGLREGYRGAPKVEMEKVTAIHVELLIAQANLAKLVDIRELLPALTHLEAVDIARLQLIIGAREKALRVAIQLPKGL